MAAPSCLQYDIHYVVIHLLLPFTEKLLHYSHVFLGYKEHGIRYFLVRHAVKQPRPPVLVVLTIPRHCLLPSVQLAEERYPLVVRGEALRVRVEAYYHALATALPDFYPQRHLVLYVMLNYLNGWDSKECQLYAAVLSFRLIELP